MPINNSDLRAAAVEYARKGWMVHPLKPRKKEPNSPHGCNDAIADIEKIDKWWAQHPDDNIGLATGHSFFVLDIDPEGEQWFESNDLPETIQERTVRGGRHLIYTLPPNVTIRNSVGKLAPGVDIRGLGGYIVASPSVVMACASCRLSYDKGHKPGCAEKSHSLPVSYAWLDCDGVVPSSAPADAPLWIVDAIQKLAAPAPNKKFTLPDHIPLGVQHRTLMEYGCSLRSKTLMDEDEIYAHLVDASQRCEKIPPASHMRKMAKSIMKYPQGLSDTFAERALNKLVAYIDRQLPPVQPVADEPITDELLFANPISTAISSDDPKQVWAAIDFLSGLDEDEYQSYRLDIKSHFKSRIPVAALDEARRKHHRKTDDGSADEKKISPNDIADQILRDTAIINVDRYLYEYTDNHWKSISDDRLKALAVQYEGKFHTSMRRRSEISSYIQATTHRRNQQWRILKPYEIPVANGVIDIRSMGVRPHRPDDMLRACISIEYNPRAQASVLMKVLDTYFGGDDDGENKISALQEFFGYCLMPHALYKKALCCFGESNCGKSTIPYLIRELIGIQNISSVPLEDMDDSRKIAPMMGKMVNLLGDLPQNGVIGEGGFKKLVSVGETIQFDPKYLPPVEEISTCKVLFCANPPLPKIGDQSKAMYERLLLVQFLYEIPRLEQDRGIQAKLSTEREGLLLWALEGAQRLYLADGQFTTVGQKELKAYREEQNPFNDFITDECEPEPDVKTPVSDIHAKYSKWYGRPVTPQYLCQLIRGAGYEITRNPVWIGTRRTRAVIGLRLSQSYTSAT